MMHQVPRRHAYRALGALLVLLVLASTHALASTVRRTYDHHGLRQVARERDHASFAALEAVDGGDSALFSLHRAADSDEVTARVGGLGRHWSDGISIVHTSGEKLVTFSPPRINVGWVETCEPTMHIILATNRASESMRIQDVHFGHQAFKLAGDPRGVVVAPGESVSLEVLFVSPSPESFNTHMTLVTSIGEFVMPVRGHTRLSSHGLVGLKVSLPKGVRLEHAITLHNPDTEVLRVTEAFSLHGVGDVVLPTSHDSSAKVAQWYLAPHTTKTIAKLVFSGPPGHYESTVRLTTPKKQFVVPVQIDVWDDELVIEPRDVDVGVFATDHERRDVLFTFHNTALHPVKVKKLEIVHSDGIRVRADFQGPTPMLPPRSRVQHAVRLTLESERHRAGPCSIRLQFVTNATSLDTASQTVALRGFSTRGHLSIPFQQTAYRVVHGVVNSDGWKEEDHQDIIVKGPPSQRLLHLRNELDTAIEILQIDLAEPCDGVTLSGFSQAIVEMNALLPTIHLTIDTKDIETTRSRVCSLRVESNATVHHVPLFFYSGSMRVSAANLATMDEFSWAQPTCGHDDSLPTADPIALRRHPDILLSCRSLWLHLTKVATHGQLEEVVNFTNINPVAVAAHWYVMAPEHMNVTAVASRHSDPTVSIEVVTAGAAWRRSSHTASDDSLLPGEQLSLRLTLHLNSPVGTFSSHVATVVTEFETVAVFVEYDAVPGTITPAVQSVDIPAVFPGRSHRLDIPFVSSFSHDVATVGVAIQRASSSGEGHRHLDLLVPLNLQQQLLANATSLVSLSFFSPAVVAACRRDAFFADCLAPHPVDWATYSHFGSRITDHDLEALAHREQQWLQPHHVALDVVLQTNAMHCAPVRVTASIVRPPLFSGGSNVAASLEFPLTEVRQQMAQQTVDVFNPSDFDMDMELAVAESDAHLFYACDDDLTDAECLHEWQDIATTTTIAPLLVRSRVVRVEAGKTVTLGPVYFFPSSVGEWTPRVFVRNELTHIESVAVRATSGIGQLAITDDGSSRRMLVNNDTLVFAVDEAEDGEGFQSTRTLQLTNRGSYRVLLTSVRMVDDAARHGFAVLEGHKDMMELAPNASLALSIQFIADCYHSRHESQLEVGTRDGVTRIRLKAFVSATQAFECRLLRWTEASRQHANRLWMIATSVALLAALGALVAVAQDARRRFHRPTKHEMPVAAVVRGDSETQPRSSGLLEELQQIEAAASRTMKKARKTRAVEKLRAARTSKLKPVEAQGGSSSSNIDLGVATVAVKAADAGEPRPPVDVKAVDLRIITAAEEPPTHTETPLEPQERLDGDSSDALLEQRSNQDEVVAAAKPAAIPSVEPVTVKSAENPPQNNQVDEEPLGISVADTVAKDKDDDTVSEEDSENNQVLEADGDGSDTFSWPADGIDELPLLQEPLPTSPVAIDDDWNTLAFDSLQSEIGRLLIVDDMPQAIEPVLQLKDESRNNNSGGVLEGLSMAPPLLPMSSLFAAIPQPTRSHASKPAPPGFTPADADPAASRAAFERLRQQRPTPPSPQTTTASNSTAVGGAFHHSNAFAGRYSLFGSVLEPDASAAQRPLRGVGHIGGSRQTRGDAPTKRSLASPLAVLGGARFPAASDSEDSR